MKTKKKEYKAKIFREIDPSKVETPVLCCLEGCLMPNGVFLYFGQEIKIKTGKGYNTILWADYTGLIGGDIFK